MSASGRKADLAERLKEALAGADLDDKAVPGSPDKSKSPKKMASPSPKKASSPKKLDKEGETSSPIKSPRSKQASPTRTIEPLGKEEKEDKVSEGNKSERKPAPSPKGPKKQTSPSSLSKETATSPEADNKGDADTAMDISEDPKSKGPASPKKSTSPRKATAKSKENAENVVADQVNTVNSPVKKNTKSPVENIPGSPAKKDEMQIEKDAASIPKGKDNDPMEEVDYSDEEATGGLAKRKALDNDNESEEAVMAKKQKTADESTPKNIVLVKNLTRPLRLPDMKEYCASFGNVIDLWLDSIKSTALVTVCLCACLVTTLSIVRDS